MAEHDSTLTGNNPLTAAAGSLDDVTRNCCSVCCGSCQWLSQRFPMTA